MVNRHQRGRAGSIDRQTRALEVQDIGDPVGRDAQRGPAHEIRVGRAGIVYPAMAPVHARDADVDRAVRAGEALRDLPAVFQRLPGELQRETLLWIHLGRFPRRDTEEVSVETLDIVQEASRECVALAGHSTVALKVVVSSPAIGADRTDYVTPLLENFPELRRGVGSRKAARHAYDRDMVPGSQIAVPSPSVICWMPADPQDSGRFPDRCRHGRESQSGSRPRMAPGY